MAQAAEKTATAAPDLTRFAPADLALEPWPPFPPEECLGGNPNGHRGMVLYRSPDKLYSVGVWECPPAKLRVPYEGTEFGHVLKGKARLTNLGTGQVQTIGAGDHFFIPFGATVLWEVLEPFRKVYTMYEAEWLEERFY